MSDDEEIQRLLEMRQALLAKLQDEGIDVISSDPVSNDDDDSENDTLENSPDIENSPKNADDSTPPEFLSNLCTNPEESCDLPVSNGLNGIEDDQRESSNDRIGDDHVSDADEVPDDDMYSDNSDFKEEMDMEIDEMLEKPVEDDANGDRPNIKKRRVLEFRGTDHFDVLPDGWVEITHSSGLPVYLHRFSRVCTFSRPYFIGPGSTRHHHVPDSAIPCLFQKKVLKQVEEQEATLVNGSNETNRTEGSCPFNGEVRNKMQAPTIKVQTSEDFKNSQLDPDALHEYAKSVFRFKTITYRRFSKWPEARTFYKNQKRIIANKASFLGDSKRPGLPTNFQLITVPMLDNLSKPQQRNFTLNPVGKTTVNVLHEYVQKVLKSTVNYEYTDTRSCATPYKCIAKLSNPTQAHARLLFEKSSIREKLLLLQDRDKQENDKNGEEGKPGQEEELILGEGCGSSKKVAKLNAAKEALKILIPSIEFNDDGFAIFQKGDEEGNAEDVADIFRLLPIEDSRIPDLCQKAGQPMPYLILSECLKRNNTLGDTNISTDTKRIKHQRHEYIMKVGKHEVKVICTNSREGKQKAAQAMLKKLHPKYDTFGSILRLYGYKAQQRHKEAIRSKKSVIQLQTAQKMASENDAHSLEPNTIILDKLRSEMNRLAKGTPGVRPTDLDFKTGAIMDEPHQKQSSQSYDERFPEFESIPALNL